MDEEDKKFQKNLAVIQLKVTIALGIGTTLITLGIALIVFTFTITPNLSLQQLNSNYFYIVGLATASLGAGLLIGSLTSFKSKIKKL